MKLYRIVCIDDDEQFLRSLEGLLPDKVNALCSDFQCCFEFASSVEELFDVLKNPAPDASLSMMIADQKMTGTTGIELIEKLKVEYPNIVTVLLTGHGSLDSAKHAINRQLLDQYLSKPIEDINVFVSLIVNLLKRHHLDLEERERTEQLAKTVLQLRKSNEQLSEMQAAAEQVVALSRLLKNQDLGELMETAAHEAAKLFAAQNAALCFAADDPAAVPPARLNCPCPQEELLRRVKREAEKLNCATYHNCVPDACCMLGAQSPRVLVPLSDGEQTNGRVNDAPMSGYLCVCGIDPASAACEKVLKYKAQLLGEILGVSLENAYLYQQAKRDSETDILTGIHTRRILKERLDAEFQRTARYARPFSLVMVDADNFKNINDTCGHVAGDRVLRQLAGTLAREIRETDCLARYGGDEFVVLMPETILSDAANAAERMRASAERIVLPRGGSVTISCGVAGWCPSCDRCAQDVLYRADVALRQAKQAGKNRVQISNPAEPQEISASGRSARK